MDIWLQTVLASLNLIVDKEKPYFFTNYKHTQQGIASN